MPKTAGWAAPGPSLPKMTALNRKHEQEHMEMHGRHMKAHHEMAMKHHSERHAMHQRHETEMMQQAPGEAAVAGATPSGEGGAVGGAGEMAPGSMPQMA